MAQLSSVQSSYHGRNGSDLFVPFAGNKQHWIRVQISSAKARIREFEKRGQLHNSIETKRWRQYLAELTLLQTKNQYRIEHLRILIKRKPILLSNAGVYVSRGHTVTFVAENSGWYQVTSHRASGYLSKRDVHLLPPVDIHTGISPSTRSAPVRTRDDLDMAARDTVAR